MKKRILPILLVAFIVAISVISPLMSFANDSETITNNAYSDFSSTNNPNGVWSYESRVFNESTSKYDYTLLSYANNVWGTESLGSILTVESCMETSKPAIRVKPSNDLVTDGVITYKAPESGTIQISMTNDGVFSTTRNGSGKGLIHFSLLHNDVVITSIADLDGGHNKNNPFFGEPMALIVKKGDIIRFVVGKNGTGNVYADLSPEITYARIEKPKPKEYSAAAEFSDADSQWRFYGYNINTLQFEKLQKSGERWGTGGNCSIAVGTDPVSEKKTMSLHSGLSLDPTLAFVAPYTGKLNLSMNNGGVFAPDSGYDGINFTLRLNDDIIKTEKINSVNNYEGHRLFTDKIELSVIAGDIIYFSVNQNKNTRGDSTYFDPHIEYTETVGEYDSTLRFLKEDTISCTNLYKDSFDISWPTARGGIADYEYTVYISKTPISDVPATDGIKIENARKYSFKDLECGTAYYVGVVASDGVSKVLLTNKEPVNTISKLFVFNGYDDFNNENMAAPWSYEVKPSGSSSYKKLQWSKDGFWGDKVSNGYITTAVSDLVTGKKSVLLEPYAGATLSLTFTAPYTGSIDLSLANGGVMVPYNGAGNKWDGINFNLTKNGETLIKFDAVNASNCHPSSKGDMYKGRVFDGKLSLDVKAGDVFRFTVNPNQAFGNDKTYFNPEIIYTEVQEGSLNLHFEDGKKISGENISDKEMTVVIPSAFGGTGNNNYTLYYSKTPITNIPATGGIELGNATSYKLSDLTAYTNYYFAVKVDDGENTATIISSQPISTIGNTYWFNAMEDWRDGGQPIDTPWRYCMQSIKDGTLKELNWNSQKNAFKGDSKTPSISASTNAKDPVTGKPALNLHPDADYNLAILFTAPYSGNATLDASNGGVFTPFNGAAQKFDGINFSVTLNGNTLYSKSAVCGNNNHNDRCFSNPIDITVKRGDKICFVINKNDVVNSDTTFFNPRVTYTFVEKGSDSFAFWPDASVSSDDVTNNSFTLKWSSAMGPNGAAKTYSVWLSKTPINSKPTTNPVYSGSSNSCKCSNLSIGTRYYAYIEAVDKAGAKSTLNPNSFVMTKSPIYNANTDFNTKNDAGIWNYAVRTKDPKTGEIGYKLLNYNDGSYGTTAKGSIKTAVSDLVCGKNVMSFHPGSSGQAPALVFTAPYSGEIQISMINGGVFCPNNGAEQNFDGIAFDVLKNGSSVFRLDCVTSKNNPEKDRVFTTPITVAVKQGDKIYFVVEPNGNNASDSTYFNPQIEYLNITGGNGKITTLSGFESAEKMVEDENNLTFVNYRKGEVKEASSASGYRIELEDDENYIKQIVLYVIIALLAFVIVAFAISIILNKSKKH